MAHPVTILSVPAHDERKLEGCRERGADIIMLDLEDAVPPEHKAQARENLARYARPGDLVRIDSSDDDLIAVRNLAFAASVVIPKCDHPARFRHLGRVGAWVSIESPRGLLALPEFFVWPEALPAGLLFCHADYMLTAGLHARMGAGVTHAMTQVALYARAYGIPCYDSPSESLAPIDIKREAIRAFHLGFTGKGAYHPVQLAVIRETWQAEQRAALAGVRGDDLDAWAGGCALTDNGRILAPPSVARYRKLREEAG